MDFKEMFDFLEVLWQNNSKEWMDQNRKWYLTVRDNYKKWLEELDRKLAEINIDYSPTPPSEALNRINNNLLFQPDKPTYKDNFGASLDKKTGTGDFYIHLGLNESFIAGGFYHPQKEHLRSIREAIDYNGEELVKILEKKSFKKMFGGLIEDEKLKTAPKGYSREHPHIKLLRNKNFAVLRPLTKKQIYSPGFMDLAVETYSEMLPFQNYLNRAVTV